MIVVHHPESASKDLWDRQELTRLRIEGGREEGMLQIVSTLGASKHRPGLMNLAKPLESGMSPYQGRPRLLDDPVSSPGHTQQ